MHKIINKDFIQYIRDRHPELLREGYGVWLLDTNMSPEQVVTSYNNPPEYEDYTDWFDGMGAREGLTPINILLEEFKEIDSLLREKIISISI